MCILAETLSEGDGHVYPPFARRRPCLEWPFPWKDLAFQGAGKPGREASQPLASWVDAAY